jgi:hypothetical protein
MKLAALLPLLVLVPAIGHAGSVGDVYDGPTGATCVKFNIETGVPWKNPGMDWVDAAGTPQGDKPFATVSVRKYQTGTVRFEVPKALLSAAGIIVRHTTESVHGNINFQSRETANGPRLVLTLANNTLSKVSPTADTSIAHVQGHCISKASIGTRQTLFVGYGALIAFGKLPANVTSAALEMDILKAYGAGTLGLYAMTSPMKPEVPAPGGFSAKYPGDKGIELDPRVIYFESWDNQPEDWWRRSMSHERFPWTLSWTQDNGRFPWYWLGVFLDSTGGFKGAGLRLEMSPTTTAGTIVPTANVIKLKGREYDQLFVRYYLKFGPDFRDATACSGGKLPGFASDTTKGGNNGGKVNGTNGWTMRGAYLLNCDPGNPIYPGVVNSTYAYHADMIGPFGDEWTWTGRGETGVAGLTEWHCLEQQVKVNTPGVRDGVMRTWIDGKLALEKTDVYMRAKPPYVIAGDMGIQKMWGTLHHGGKAPFGHKATLWYDQTVVATERVGCMAN